MCVEERGAKIICVREQGETKNCLCAGTGGGEGKNAFVIGGRGRKISCATGKGGAKIICVRDQGEVGSKKLFVCGDRGSKNSFVIGARGSKKSFVCGG